VLIGPGCVSSNESFLLMMKHGAHATLVGEPSFGSSGNPKPIDLGNGVTVILPSWEDQLPDGTVLEGHGVQPDLPASLGSDPSRDGVLEAALAALRKQPR
jgi:C-terminal processing protease CtpA/Prc